MRITSENFRDALLEIGVQPEEEVLQRFELYRTLLLEWNKKMNLTAIVEPEQVMVKHFLDSLLLLRCVELRDGQKLLDVGTGAGFPGVPLKIARPGISLSLLDSLKKRIGFLKILLEALGFEAELLDIRAEEGSRRLVMRESFDVVTSRAVAALAGLCEYCLPYVRVGGVFAALKGPNNQTELQAAEQAISLLGGKVADVKNFVLPDESERAIILIEKVAPTPEKYPRRGTKISKNPL